MNKKFKSKYKKVLAVLNQDIGKKEAKKANKLNRKFIESVANLDKDLYSWLNSEREENIYDPLTDEKKKELIDLIQGTPDITARVIIDYLKKHQS